MRQVGTGSCLLLMAALLLLRDSAAATDALRQLLCPALSAVPEVRFLQL